MPKQNDLTGELFGRLLVIELAGKQGKHNLWKCRCNCGNFKDVRADLLRNGNTKSCGCLHKEIARNTFTKHGKSQKEKLYKVWTSIKQRCLNPKAQNYDRYGGRGIKVCADWQNNFLAFYDWAMSNGYIPGLEIDRINNDSGYEPSNCRWVTDKVNANNRHQSNQYLAKKKSLKI